MKPDALVIEPMPPMSPEFLDLLALWRSMTPEQCHARGIVTEEEIVEMVLHIGRS